MSFITSYASRTYTYARAHPRRLLIGLVVVLAALAGALYFAMRGGADVPAETVAQQKTAELASIAALGMEGGSLVILGEVRSVTQAELRPEKPGEVTRVNVKPGQYVAAGTILAEIENASERAGVAQAQGGLAAAQANLAKVRAGDRVQDRAGAVTSAQSAKVSLDAALDSGRTAYSQAYNAASEAVLSTSDDLFKDPYNVNPNFRVLSATYDERAAVSRERIALGTLLDAWKSRVSTPISESELDARLEQADNDLRRVRSYLATISTYVSKQELSSELTAAQKSAQEAGLAGARSSVDGARSAIAGARTGLANARNAAAQGDFAVSKSLEGARPEDIATAQASVAQARAGVSAAAAVLERSRIRTPIAGTVETLNVTRGSFVSGQEVAAVVANPSAREVEAFVTQSDLERVYVGMRVLVAGIHDGIVTTVAPGLDPATKKARITIGLPKGAELTNGSFVELALEGSASSTPATRGLMPRDGWRIPVEAVKVLPSGLVVLTVNGENRIESRPIKEGTIVNGYMLVREGLTPDLRIVKDARGLIEGEQVLVK